MYSRAVWKEGEREEEGVVPDNWIDRNKRTVRWPRNMSTTKTERALKDRINPQEDWMVFPLIKIKMTSAKRRECDNYNLTSQAEEEDDDEEEVAIRSTRNRTKKGLPEDFVRNEFTDSDEESVRGVKLSDYPTAPKKLQPIQDTNMLHNASSEDEAMTFQVECADSSGASEMSTCHSGNRALSHPVKPAGKSRGREMTTPREYNYISSCTNHPTAQTESWRGARMAARKLSKSCHSGQMK